MIPIIFLAVGLEYSRYNGYNESIALVMLCEKISEP